MFDITKEFPFEASHELDRMPADHPCRRNHGHSYRVRVTLQSKHLDAMGMVLDYHRLSGFGAWIKAEVDHHRLNDVFPGVHPTAENLAGVMALELERVLNQEGGLPKGVRIAEVAVSETRKTWARWRPDR